MPEFDVARASILELIDLDLANLSESERSAWFARIEELKRKDLVQVIADQTHGRVEYQGFIYILTNPVMPGLVKIGYTCFSVELRAAELSQPTGVPQPFRVECKFAVYDDPKRVEAAVHEAIDIFRLEPNREFFRFSVERAKEFVASALARFSPDGLPPAPIDR